MRVRPWNDPWKLAGNEDISVLGSRTQYELCQPEICPPDIMTHRQNDIDHGCSAMAWWSSSSRYSCWCSLTHATHPNIVLDKGSPPSLPLCHQRSMPVILQAPLNLIPIWAIFRGQVDAQGSVQCLWLAACFVLLWNQRHHCVQTLRERVCASVRVCACSVCSAVLSARFVSARIHMNGRMQDFAVRWAPQRANESLYQ